MSNWLVLAGGLAALLTSHALSYSKGESAGRHKAEASYAKALREATDKLDAKSAAIERMTSEQLLADQAREITHKEIIRESVQIIDRPVYRSVCIDADGLRLLDQIAGNANGQNPAASAHTAAGTATGTAQR